MQSRSSYGREATSGEGRDEIRTEWRALLCVFAGELGNVARHKRGLTSWRGGRGRSGSVSLEAWHVTNEDSRPGGEEEGGAGRLAWKRCTSYTIYHYIGGRISTCRADMTEHT